MTRSLRALVPLLALAGCGARSPTSSSDVPVLVIRGATVVDAERVLERATVTIRGAKILSVTTGAAEAIPAGAQVIDGTGRFVIPGMIDSHVHFFQSGGLYTRPDVVDLDKHKPYRQERAEQVTNLDVTFARYLRSGFTTVVDAGGPRWNFEVRAKAQSSERAPSVFAAGPLISTVSREALALDDPPIIQAKSPEDARAMVRALAPLKPDLIKIWYVASEPADAERNFPIVKAAADETHALGLRLAVHATELATARKALEAGADVLVHSVVDAPVDAAFIAALKARDVIYVPTLSVGEGYRETFAQRLRFTPEEWAWSDPRTLDSLTHVRWIPEADLSPRVAKALAEGAVPAAPAIAMQNLRTLWSAGVIVAAGSDAGNIGTPPGPGLYRDFELMVEAGLTPLEVLTSATRNGARTIARTDRGLVKEGLLADLLVLDADPRASVHNLGRIHTVIKSGVALAPAQLLPETPRDVVWRQIAAQNVHDIDAFVAAYADHIVMYRGDEKKLEGHTELRAVWAELFVKYPKMRVRVLRERVQGNTVVLNELAILGDGRELPAEATYTVERGRITRVSLPAQKL